MRLPIRLIAGRYSMARAVTKAADSQVVRHSMRPSSLLAEAMAQIAGLTASDASDPASPAVLAQIDRFRCHLPIVVGDRLLVVARVVRRFGSTVKVRASVKVAGRFRAAAELVLHCPQAVQREQ